MASHTHDTKLVHVDGNWGGYHPNYGGMPYITCGKEGLANKFKGFTKQPAAGSEKPHAKTRKENVPDTQPKSVTEGVPTKPDADNPKISMDIQELPPPVSNQN